MNHYTQDSLVNALTGLGTSRDKSTSNVWEVDPYDYATLMALFAESWLAQRITIVLAEEATKKWRDISTGSMTPEQKELFETIERKLKVKRSIRLAKMWASLFGGAGIYIAIEGDDFEMPLEIERVKKGARINLITLNRNDITPNMSYIIDDEFDINYGLPEYYRINQSNTEIHASRFMRFNGLDAPEYLLKSNSYWGLSVFSSTLRKAVEDVETIIRQLTEALKQSNVDVVSVPELFLKLSDKDTLAQVRARFAEGSLVKEAYGMLLLDKEEEFSRHESANALGAGVNILGSVLQIPSGATGIPVTKLLGISPGGLNATGDSDLENFYGMIEDSQNGEIADAVNVIDAVICQSLFGRQFDDWSYTWNTLWQADKKEEAEISVMRTNEVIGLRDAGLFTDSVALQQLLDDGRFSAMTDEYLKEFDGVDDDTDTDVDEVDTDTDTGTNGDVFRSGEDVQRQALNGAQISSLIDIAAKVKSGEIDVDSAVGVILTAIPSISEPEARAIAGKPGNVQPQQESEVAE